eukprot:symbB.v1.2.003661.t1/scaffold175.1/size369221/17
MQIQNIGPIGNLKSAANHRRRIFATHNAFATPHMRCPGYLNISGHSDLLAQRRVERRVCSSWTKLC